jgi:hypothetical protein
MAQLPAGALPLATLALLLGACASGPRTSTVTARVEQLPITADTGLNAQLQREIAARHAAAERVTALRVTSPDTLRLAVGRRHAVWDVELEATDSAGQRIAPFTPTFAVADPTILDLQGGHFVARRAGSTTIVIGTTRTDPATGRRRMVSLAQLPVVVARAP